MNRRLYIAKSGARHAPTLPIDALTSTIAVLGQRDTGKTNTGVVIAEEVVRAGGHVAVLDPVGAWWGVTRAGAKRGMPGVVIGGEHADVPLEETGGELVADIVLSRQWPIVVIDMKLLRKGAQLRFMAGYLETLYDRNRRPLLQVFEEAHRALPQDRSNFDVTAARVLGAGEDIVTLGRSRGLGALLITQRAARLNKNVLESCSLLVLLRLMGANDRKAAKGWVEAQGDESKWRPVLESIATLRRGEAWLWGTVGDEAAILERVRVRERHTFDSSFTPKIGEEPPELPQRAPVDLDELRSRMAETVKRAEENDPKRLRERIAELERQLVKMPGIGEASERLHATIRERDERIGELEGQLANMEEAPYSEPERVEVPVLADETLGRVRAELDDVEERVADLWRDGEQQVERMVERMREPWDKAVGAMREEAERIREQVQRAGAASAAGGVVRTPARAVVGEERRQDVAAPASPRRAESNGSRSAEQRVLDALAWLASVGIAPASRLQVAMVAGYHPRTNAFTHALAVLAEDGAVEGARGVVALTAAGQRRAAAPAKPLTQDELRRLIFEQVGDRKARVLRALLERGGPMSRDELAAALGYHPRTNAFTHALASLRTLGLLDFPRRGEVAATSVLSL